MLRYLTGGLTGRAQPPNFGFGGPYSPLNLKTMIKQSNNLYDFF